MRFPSNHIPILQCHGPRRQARVKLSGVDVYLGDFDDPDVRGRYEQVIAQWLANARRWPPPAESTTTVEELGDLFIEYAESYYTKSGRKTSTAGQAARALALLYRAGLAQILVNDFTPASLQAFQRWLCSCPGQPFARRTINTYAGVIVMMFRWAVAEGLAHESSWRSLQAVRPLRRGRSPAAGVTAPREGGKVRPVAQGVLEATLAKARPMLRDMIELQLATGMRPSEVVGIRPMDLVRTIEPGVYAYRVRADFNKTDHHDIERVVYIGPRGMSVLRPWLAADPGSHTTDGEAFAFSPREARRSFDDARRAARKSKRWPSHSSESRAARKPRPKRPALRPGARYTTGTYARAIARAAAAAGVDRWGPNRLRHNAASYIVEHEAIEVAQLLLGHRHVATTMRYVQVENRRAVAAALKHG